MPPLVQTRAQAETELSNAVAVLHEIRKAAGLNPAAPTSNILSRLETFVESNQGEFSNLAHLEAFRLRNLLAQACSRDAARSVLTPLLRNYARVIGTIPETDPREILRRLREDFISTPRRIKSRNISHGTPAAGSNIGTGTINRLTVDEDGFELENVHIESKRADCVRDEHTGADEHQEVFEITGQDEEVDEIAVSGSATRAEIKATDARESLASNASFSERAGTDAAPTSITDWTFNNIANVILDTTNYYRDFVGDDTPRALRVNATEYIRQNFNVNRLQLDFKRPYYAQLAFNRSVGTGVGTLEYVLGSKRTSVSLAGQPAGWNILRLPIGQDNWPDRFADVENPMIAMVVNLSSGYVILDDVLLVPYDLVDGTYYKAVGGATPFLRDDSFTWADTLAGSEGLIAFYLWLAFGENGDPSLPGVTNGTEDWADPNV